MAQAKTSKNLKSSICTIIIFAMFFVFAIFNGTAQFSNIADAQSPDPCPQASSALMQTPNDLSKIQADIERYTLCVERAQLLKRLNDLALENEKNVNGPSIGGPGMMLNANIPDLSFQQPSDFMVPPEQDFNDFDNEYENEDWKIMSIFGSGGNLTVRLSKTGGELAQGHVGDVLPDGTTITQVNSTDVTIEDQDGTRVLNWSGQ